MASFLMTAFALMLGVPAFFLLFFTLAAFVPAALFGSIGLGFILMIIMPLLILSAGAKSGSPHVSLLGTVSLIVAIVLLATAGGRELCASIYVSVGSWF